MQQKKQQWSCRWAPSLGALESTHQAIWGTKEYNPATDLEKSCVFFGLYGLNDFYALWRHKGRKAIFWAGSDILHFRTGYWLDDKGEITLGWAGGKKIGKGSALARWINEKCENYVENEGEAWQLKDCGIEVTAIIPSFLGDIKKYPVSFKPGNKVYVSAHEGSQHQYGFGIVQAIAHALPEIEFHLYGASWQAQPLTNIIVHGRVPKGKMNNEIQQMQCGLRLNKHDGFSEITAKSILWGQWPISYLYLPHIQQYTNDNCGQPTCLNCLNNLVKLLKQLPYKRKPNFEARAYYLKTFNLFPWNNKL